MRVGHRLDDGEAEPAAGDALPGAAARESLEHATLLGIRYPGAAIGHVDLEPGRGGGDPDLDRVLVAGIVPGVVDQVGEGLAQRDRVAFHHGRAVERAQVELDRRADAASLGPLRHLAQQRHQLDRLARRHLAAMADHGVAEQLIGDLARQGGVAMDLVDVAAQRRRVLLLGGEIGLGAQGGERRADLMRGVGKKASASTPAWPAGAP